MKQNARMIFKCSLFQIVEHGVMPSTLGHRSRIVGNARSRPSTQIDDFYPVREIKNHVAEWRIATLRGQTGVPNPGGKDPSNFALCPEGERADCTIAEREAEMREIARQQAAFMVAENPGPPVPNACPCPQCRAVREEMIRLYEERTRRAENRAVINPAWVNAPYDADELARVEWTDRTSCPE